MDEPESGPARSDRSLGAAAFLAAGSWAFVAAGLDLAPGARWVEVAGIGFHLLLLPLAARLDASEWARASAYAWIAVDVTVSVFTIDGGPVSLAMPVRLGGHVFAAVWIAAASGALPPLPRWTGRALALCLGAHSLVAPYYGPPVLLGAAGVVMPVWLALVGLGPHRNMRSA